MSLSIYRLYLTSHLKFPHQFPQNSHVTLQVSLWQPTFFPRRKVLYQSPGFSLDQEASFT